MTPLLPSVTVGTVETRTVIESIRSLIGPRIKFIEASCANVDVQAKSVTCNARYEKSASDSNDPKSVRLPSKEELGASSRVTLDSGIDIYLSLSKLVLNFGYKLEHDRPSI